MERLFEPQFQIYALTTRPQFLPDTHTNRILSREGSVLQRERWNRGRSMTRATQKFRWRIAFVDLVLSGVSEQGNGDKGKKTPVFFSVPS